MPDSSCEYEEPLFVLILNWITSFISIPIYGISFIVLLMKCPKHFEEYRKYLVIHIISGLLLDCYIRIIWKLSIPLPWASLCSFGIASEYSANVFQIFVFLLIFTGITTLAIFQQRMKAVHLEETKLEKVVFFFRNTFYSFCLITLSFTLLIYSDLKYQKEYKTIMEYKFGKLPDYIWCNVCVFLRFDSKLFIIFYVFAYTTVVLVVTAGVLASIETLRALNSNLLRLSPKTTAIQKNFMFSLIVSVTVHLTLICIPLALHFFVSFYAIHNQYIAPLGILMIQDHGTVSTFTMIITNKLLRKATRKLFLIPENLLRKSEPRIFKRKQKNTSGIDVLN